MRTEDKKGVRGTGRAMQCQLLVEFLKFNERGVGDEVDFSVRKKILEKFLGIRVAHGDVVEAIDGVRENATENFVRNFSRNYWPYSVREHYFSFTERGGKID